VIHTSMPQPHVPLTRPLRPAAGRAVRVPNKVWFVVTGLTDDLVSTVERITDLALHCVAFRKLIPCHIQHGVVVLEGWGRL
jgi:hypothetical protein